jgi:hypothetical protein
VVSANNNRDRTQFLKLKLEIYLGVRELAEKIHALGGTKLFLCSPAFYCSAEFCDTGHSAVLSSFLNLGPLNGGPFSFARLRAGLAASQPPNQDCADDNDKQNSQLTIKDNLAPNDPCNQKGRAPALGFGNVDYKIFQPSSRK